MSDSPDPSNPFAAPKADVRRSSGGGRKPLATLNQRLSGAMFDQLLPMASILLLLLATGDLGSFQDIAAGQNYETLSPNTLIGMPILVVLFAVVQLYLIFTSRQTIGKRIVGSRIHNVDGTLAHPVRILVLRGFVPGMLYVIPVAGAFFLIFGHLAILGQERRCLHDYIAGSVVLEA